jgi:hypothetical protein
MKVFEVSTDGDDYQMLEPEDKQPIVDGVRLYMFDGTPKAEDWMPLSLYIPNPTRPRPNFFHSFLGAFVVSPATMTPEIAEFLEMAGELLPLPFEGQEFEIANILEVVNCINANESIWKTYPSGKKLVRKPAFYPDRFGESSISKIPEMRYRIFCYEGIKSREDEFKTYVEDNHLTGLKFREVWSDEK